MSYAANTGLMAETDRVPISKRYNDVRIDSACWEQLQSRFTRRTYSQREIWLGQIEWKCDGPSALQAVRANSDNSVKFL